MRKVDVRRALHLAGSSSKNKNGSAPRLSFWIWSSTPEGVGIPMSYTTDNINQSQRWMLWASSSDYNNLFRENHSAIDIDLQVSILFIINRHLQIYHKFPNHGALCIYYVKNKPCGVECNYLKIYVLLSCNNVLHQRRMWFTL